MRPILLPKNEIDKRKAEEQRQKMEEGMRVAERVDTLREIAASEESALELYRQQMLKNLNEDLRDQTRARDALAIEVEALTKERERLAIPPDFEWGEITHLESVLREKQLALDTIEAQVAETKLALEIREREIRVAEDKAKDLTRLASATYAEAEAQLIRAREDAAHMKEKSDAESILVSLRDSEVRKKEESLHVQEAALKEKEIRIEKYEIDLAKREATLRAGWKRLEATQKKLS